MLSMFSCTDINKQLEEMIPADSRGVVRIDVKSVIEKGQLADEDGNVVFPQSLKDVMSKNESAPVSEAMTLLRKIGIDTDANIYCFVPKTLSVTLHLSPLMMPMRLKRRLKSNPVKNFKRSRKWIFSEMEQ